MVSLFQVGDIIVDPTVGATAPVAYLQEQLLDCRLYAQKIEVDHSSLVIYNSDTSTIATQRW